MGRLQFLLLPIRDWNQYLFPTHLDNSNCNFYYSLLGIETHNTKTLLTYRKLQFLLLPIRDWNQDIQNWEFDEYENCNFYYSLLGIETYTIYKSTI